MKINALHLLWIVPVSILAGMVAAALAVAFDRVSNLFSREDDNEQ